MIVVTIEGMEVDGDDDHEVNALVIGDSGPVWTRDKPWSLEGRSFTVLRSQGGYWHPTICSTLTRSLLVMYANNDHLGQKDLSNAIRNLITSIPRTRKGNIVLCG